jgi:hypothetical protein
LPSFFKDIFGGDLAGQDVIDVFHASSLIQNQDFCFDRPARGGVSLKIELKDRACDALPSGICP